MVLLDLLAALVGYLLGGLPVGPLVARFYGKVDLTTAGSGRTGATNVLRTLGPGAAAVVFAGDFFKGSAAVLAGGLLTGGDPWGMALGGVGAVIGHAYSPYMGFKGGRGVTTGLGGLLIIAPLLALAGAIVGAIVIAATRYVSLGSILGTSAAALSLLLWTLASDQPPAYAAFAILVGAFIVIAHRDNINRLLHGTERRLGRGAEPPRTAV